MHDKEQIKKDRFLSIFQNDYPLISENGLQSKALDYYQQHNFPGLKDEGWRQTNLSALFRDEFREMHADAKSIDIEKYRIPGLKANMLVFINGFYSVHHSEIISSGLKTGSIRDLSTVYPDVFKKHFESTDIHAQNNFTALNTAFAHDGSFIYISGNEEIGEPVHLLHINQANAPLLAQLRNLVILEHNSRITILESFHTSGKLTSFTNVVTEVIVEKNAQVEWLRLQEENQQASQMNHLHAIAMADSSFRCNTITLSGMLIRNHISVRLAEEGAYAELFGLYLVRNKQLTDNYTNIEHAAPHCQSNQVYKGILDDEGSGVFFGKVYVAKDAQKTNAYQSNRNVLLSEDAKINSKPQLEIYADDVSCSHGSTTGQLDQESMFYMQSRGIPYKIARNMLLHGFVSEVINNIKVQEIKAYVDTRVHAILDNEQAEK